MPKLSKKSLSLYLRNNCERQFVLSLYNTKERKEFSLPPRDENRFGLGIVGEAGYDWQAKKLGELQTVFGESNVYSNPPIKSNRPEPLPLCQELLAQLKPYQFIIEAEYRSDNFRSAINLAELKDYYGNNVEIEATRPDIVQVLPALFEEKREAQTERDPYRMEVAPDGGISLMNAKDKRLRLRVIDIKLTSEPGAHYFAEVVYYSMSLAAWLQENNLRHKFVVIAAAAVWPGSHDASNLAKYTETWKTNAHVPTGEEMARVLEEDVEVAEFEVYAMRLRRFFNDEFPVLLSKPWHELSWYVDFRCKGCEFLGYPWRDKDGNLKNDPSHCWPTAEAAGHLSRVVGLTPGGSDHLRSGQITDLVTLAGTSAKARIFDGHQGLRAKRSIFPHRAAALQNSTSSVIPYSGGDALMPRWPDLHVYVFLDYDLSSAITASIALNAFWVEPVVRDSGLDRKKLGWPQRDGEEKADEVFLVDRRSLEREREEFLKFLRRLRDIFRKVIKQDEEDVQKHRRDSKRASSTFQIYLWDESQRKHLTRLVGRHLPYILADIELRDLAWLFPPPELLQHPEDATRQSPITLVSRVIDNTVALPVAHYHRLLDVAQSYRPATRPAPFVHPLYEEPMSDLIPAERIHEWWEREGNWAERQNLIQETARKKVWALGIVVSRLEQDLREKLSRQAAPQLIRPRRALSGLSPHGRLWLEYTRLNNSLEEFETQAICAMPPHEREARLKSARLTRRLAGSEELDALSSLNATSATKLTAGSDLFVYKLREASRDVNARPGDFTYALSPETEHGFLDSHPYPIIKDTSLEGKIFSNSVARAGMTSVAIAAIDRVNGFIALRAGQSCYIRELEQVTHLDFSKNVVLDPIPADFLTEKVELTVRGIGYPASAIADQSVLTAMGMPTPAPLGKSPSSPAAEILWQASRLHKEAKNRDLEGIKERLESHLVLRQDNLDLTQWAAWTAALTRRLALIWGPPGTGKSRTLRAIILGAILDAQISGQALSLLVTANTYTAIDNVLLPVAGELTELVPADSCNIFRVQSKWRIDSLDKYANVKSLVLNTMEPSSDIKELRKRLESHAGITLIGCTPQQLHNLAIQTTTKRKRRPQDFIRQWFDLILLDEATQMDVAQSTLVFTKSRDLGACVLAGDDLQLPPIQQADPPADLEYIVGSAYKYFRRHHGIQPNSLDVNYRSNATIVEFTKLAGYSEKLKSNSPDLKLDLLSPLPAERPKNWPSQLYWSPAWSKFLDPDFPCVCFTYDDRASSQINSFEAGAVASLLWLLHGRMTDRPKNERRFDGSFDTQSSTTPYGPQGFWNRGVGVVTPHRAQMAKIIHHLQNVFHDHPPEDIRSAVDTVERFQGQQRDVIIASFGIGDPDIISTEDEFLYNLNRFNVLTSRARTKLIVFITRPLLEHLSNDVGVLKESRLLKQFAGSFCDTPEPLQLGFIDNETESSRYGILRRK